MAHRRQDSSDSTTHLLPLVHSDHKPKPKPTTQLLRFLLLFSLLSLSFLFVPRFLFPSYSLLAESDLDQPRDSDPPPCSALANSSICCDRSARRTDVCYMRGDVRTSHRSTSLLLVSSSSAAANSTEERIRPYTRKWEANTMSTIDELRLRAVNESSPCDVRHDVPAVFFSTGGYTGNVYHEFNDGIIPLYITSQRFNRKVVFVILEYHDWWITKYEHILSKLSDHAPIDFSNDKRTHCFPEAIVGLKIHDELTIDSEKMGNNKTIRDFRRLLDESYRPRIEYIEQVEEKPSSPRPQPSKQSVKPKLVIVSRNGSRGIENEGELVRLADKIGFKVEVLRPNRTTEMAKIYRALNASDVMIGVHGAAMTHLLFMRPRSVFIQVVPLGTDWAAETYYGEPAVKLGLKYMSYKILPRESSLYRVYKENDPVLRDPESVNAKGWEVTKKVYLDGQNVNLDLERFRKRLIRAYQYVQSRKFFNEKNR